MLILLGGRSICRILENKGMQILLPQSGIRMTMLVDLTPPSERPAARRESRGLLSGALAALSQLVLDLEVKLLPDRVQA